MIERLVTALQLLAASPGEHSARPPALAGDYADALRLVIDCPQIRLEPEQREALERVDDALDRGAPPARVAELARTAIALLGEAGDLDR